MSRITIPTLEEAAPETKGILENFKKQLGFVPNLFRLLSISPAALNSWVGFMTPLSKTLDNKTRDGIALAVSQVNECDYCLRAHTYVATNLAKLTTEEILMNREGRSGDPKKNAAVRFARRLIEQRGKVSDAELAAIRSAGFADQQIIEIVALSSQFLMTNFMNNVFDTDLDFPKVEGAEVK